MKKIFSHITIILLILLLTESLFQLSVVEGQPFDDYPIPSMKIISPPYPPNRYENSSVNLEVNVYLFSESQKVNNIAYSIDEEPLQYIGNLTIRSLSNFGPGRVGYTVIGKAILENLSEGNHRVEAYANGMYTSRDFIVNSNYQVTSIKILSPINQTYNGDVPLIFAVNGDIEDAYYYLYDADEPSYGPATSEKYALTGNISLTSLSDGRYEILMRVMTEKGRAETLVTFTVSNNYVENFFMVGIISLVGFAIAFVLVLYFKKHKRVRVL
jgi:hypothetical protein